MGKGAGRYEIGARRRQFLNAIESDTAGNLNLRPPLDATNRLANVVHRHVVDEYDVRPGSHRLVDFRERLRLDLNWQTRTGLPHQRHGWRDTASQADVIVLDEHGVEETNAMVGRATRGDGVFLQHPQCRRRLSGVENGDAAAGRIDEAPGSGGDPGPSRQEIERGALRHEQRARRSRYAPERVAGLHTIAVGLAKFRPNLWFQLAERLERDVDTREHAIRLRQKRAARPLVGAN